jgi:hypothetical protein
LLCSFSALKLVHRPSGQSSLLDILAIALGLFDREPSEHRRGLMGACAVLGRQSSTSATHVPSSEAIPLPRTIAAFCCRSHWQ